MNVNIKIEKETRNVSISKNIIGNDGENLQGNFVFTFDEFVDGQAMLFYEIDDEGRFDYLKKVDEQYILPIKSTITKQGTIPMQLVITEGIKENEVPIFKTNVFKVKVGSSIEDGIEQPEEYPSWLEIANTKLNQVDNLDIDIENSVVTITKKDGTTKSEKISGSGSEITEEDLEKIETNIKEDIEPILDEALENSETAISISKGANQALSFGDYETLISVFNNLDKDVYRVGQSLFVVTLDVPDLWISGITEENNYFYYMEDAHIISMLSSQGYIEVGHYRISQLETQKVDLSGYTKRTDYASSTRAGVVRQFKDTGILINSSNGKIYIDKATETDINAKTSDYKPIVPSKINSMFGTMMPTLTQVEYDALETKDENTYYCIVEEE